MYPFPFIGRLICKKIKLYCESKHKLNENADHCDENVNLSKLNDKSIIRRKFQL